jgi:dCMP deaminase
MIKEHEKKWLEGCEHLSRIFSTCSKRQYFCVIISDNKRLISQGYNGSPPGYPHCIEGHCPRAQENSPSGSSYDNCIANHAEANALLWAEPKNRQGATLIVNGPPCFSCAKLISSSGITRVIGYEDKSYAQIDQVKKFFEDNKIQLILTERNKQ